MNAIEQIFGPTTNRTAPKSSNELGQEDFLKLLVAQLKNQDPSNPADNGEFLGQIAQFSMVSGIDALSVSFDGIAGSLYASQAMQATQLVGNEVLFETDSATLTDTESVEGVLELADRASGIRVQIHDASGSLVRVIDVGNANAGMHRFNWDGLDEDGNRSVAGEYVVTAEGLIDGELQGVTLHLFSKVDSVSVDRANTNILLHLANGDSVGISQIREYR